MTVPQPYDHVRVDDDGPIPAGIYRVVGTDEKIALLQVGDSDWRRVTTGELRQVSRAEFGQFEPAENPDSRPSVGDILSPFKTFAQALRYRLPF